MTGLIFLLSFFNSFFVFFHHLSSCSFCFHSFILFFPLLQSFSEVFIFIAAGSFFPWLWRRDCREDESCSYRLPSLTNRRCQKVHNSPGSQKKRGCAVGAKLNQCHKNYNSEGYRAHRARKQSASRPINCQPKTLSNEKAREKARSQCPKFSQNYFDGFLLSGGSDNHLKLEQAQVIKSFLSVILFKCQEISVGIYLTKKRNSCLQANSLAS